jgi:hypothetical protein
MTSLEELNRTILLCRDYVADGLSDHEICHCFQSLRVLCVSDLENLSSHSGQTALVTTVSLLSRMGMQVELRIPEVAMLLPLPPLTARSIRKELLEFSESAGDRCHRARGNRVESGPHFCAGKYQGRR